MHDGFWQAELGNAVNKHAAGDVERLENGHAVAHFGQLARAGKAGGARAYNGDSLAVGRYLRYFVLFNIFAFPVGDEALEASYCDGLVLLTDYAFLLALRLLRAYAAADGGQAVVIFKRIGCRREFFLFDEFDEFGNVYADRAAGDASRLSAVEAALRLRHGFFFIVAERDLVEVLVADVGFLLAHRNFFARSGAVAVFGVRFARGYFFTQFMDVAVDARIGGVSRRGRFHFFMLIAVHGVFLFFFKALVPEQQFVEIDQIAADVGAFDAREDRFAADRGAAGAAHSGAVDHYGVEAGGVVEVVFFRHFLDGVHHNQRPDADDVVDLYALRYKVFEHVRDDAFDPDGAVVGCVVDLVAYRGHFIFQYQKRVGAGADYRYHAVASFLERAGLRIKRRDAEPAADHNDRAVFFYRGRLAEGTDEIVKRFAGFQLRELSGGFSNGLENN